MNRCVGIIIALLVALFFSACSTAPHKQESSNEVLLNAKDSLAIKTIISNKEIYTPNLDIAHESFIRAQDLELRGENDLADVFLQRAYEADRENRYLSFAIANRLFARGEDSSALVIASKAINYKGKATSKQYELLAKLYIKVGVVDSVRKYFKIALDSAHYQDMPLLYDYSLFLEAIQDKKELIKVYDALLPQTNYIQSLFNRQLNLLAELGKDSLIVDLFQKTYEATRDREMLYKMVQGLSIQKRFAEVRLVADTISDTTIHDEAIINSALLTYGENNRQEALKFLKKKVYEDKIRTPVVVYYLGSYEFILGEKDSAKVHLEQVYTKLNKEPSYAAHACRILSGISFSHADKKNGLMYAKASDSLSVGGDKVFLALSYASADVYNKAYDLLDSMLDVWSHWTPMAGIADSATIYTLRKKAEASYKQLQHTYAEILVMEARKIEDNEFLDTLKLAYAKELRIKAELFWESIIMGDPNNFYIRFVMAMNLERLGRYEDSFRIFEFLLKDIGNNKLDWPEVLNYYGYTLIDINRNPEELEKGYQLVLKAMKMENVTNEAYLDSKAWGLYKKGNFEEALATMLLIKSKNFENDYIYFEHLAAIYESLGKKSEALKCYKKLLKLRPNHIQARKFLGKKSK